ncbi:MAG: SDR family NAD(P)-dependent oxidoreductase [Halioglobus sp.]|nr:SDR family NAD(P)-dependent oxidoreductase [Halioglobus sp.]
MRQATASSDISVLVNNAGIQINTPIASASPDDIERELQINFLAPVRRASPTPGRLCLNH